MNKYLAYWYLYEDTADLKCDFEILSDEISSMIGLLRSLLTDIDNAANPDLAEDLCKINELMYHINPSLRTEVTVTPEELEWLQGKTRALQNTVEETKPGGGGLTFVIPQGCTPASYSHVIRSRCKTLVRLLSRYKQQGNSVEEILFHFVNLFSGYFYFLALWLNKNHGEEERVFVSRIYQIS